MVYVQQNKETSSHCFQHTVAYNQLEKSTFSNIRLMGSIMLRGSTVPHVTLGSRGVNAKQLRGDMTFTSYREQSRFLRNDVPAQPVPRTSTFFLGASWDGSGALSAAESAQATRPPPLQSHSKSFSLQMQPKYKARFRIIKVKSWDQTKRVCS